MSAIDAITHQPVAGDVVINGLVVGFANVAVGILRIAGKPDIRLDWALGALIARSSTGVVPAVGSELSIFNGKRPVAGPRMSAMPEKPVPAFRDQRLGQDAGTTTPAS